MTNFKKTRKKILVILLRTDTSQVALGDISATYRTSKVASLPCFLNVQYHCEKNRRKINEMYFVFIFFYCVQFHRPALLTDSY